MKRFHVLAFALIAASVRADIRYTVQVQPEQQNLHVTIHLDHTESGTRFQIPTWGPGAYVLRPIYTNVKNLAATDGHGQALEITQKLDPVQKKYQDGIEWKTFGYNICTWKVAAARETTVAYDIPLAEVDGSMHWSGPSTYLYEVDRRKEKCQLDIAEPTGWHEYLGLDETKTGSGEYVAKDYDTMADNPVTAGGDLIVDTYTSRGKPHFIVLRGATKGKVDRPHLIKACKFVSDMETDFFGDAAPYNKYVWHFAVMDAPDGAGGLEHLSSTEISLANGVGPRAVGVLAHEFFHLWNVKRIRSKPLGPFDYTKLPETGAIWWLEGVTDYYAHTLLYRYGWNDQTTYFATLASNVQNVLQNPAHYEVGPYESSMLVGMANGGRGNSDGYKISYYNQGWVAGMVLDIELRQTTNGKHSLDDVEHALWDLCKDGKPGFEEDEIRNQLVRFGGKHMGEFYDQAVANPGDMAISETLARAGLKLAATPQILTDTGFSWDARNGIVVSSVTGPAVGHLMTGDEIVGVNGQALDGPNGRAMAASLNRMISTAEAGKPLTISVKRAGDAMDITLVPGSRVAMSYSVVPIPNPTSAQVSLRAQWLAHKAFQP